MITLSFIMLTICLPAILGYMSDCVVQGSKKSYFLPTGFSVLISNAVMIAVWLFLKTEITQYELLLINVLTSLLVMNLCVPLYREKKLSPTKVLKVTCFCAIAVAVYSILTFGQILIHGDTATASILTKCQLEHKAFFPDTWYYVNGDIWVVSVQTFVAPFVMLLKDQSLARALGSVLFCLVTSYVVLYHSKKSFITDCWVIAIPLMLIFLTGQFDMILYQAAYTGQMFFLILGCRLFYNVKTQPTKLVSYFLFAGFTIISLMGGIRYLAEVIVPLWCGYIVLQYIDLRNKESIEWKAILKDVFRVSFTIMIPTVMGILIYWWLKNTHHVINSAHNALVFVSSIPKIIENFFNYISNMFVCFGFRGGISVFSIKGIMNIVSICMCILVVFVVPALQAIKFKRESHYVQFFFSFTAVHNLIMFILAICFAGKDESRYLLTSIFLCILLSSRYIYVYWISQKHFEKYIWTGLFVVAVLIGSASLLSDSVGWYGTLSHKEEVTDQLAELGLQKGYADFWTAYSHEVYSDFEIQFGGLEIYDGTPYAHFWLVDGDVFQAENVPTFLMLTEAENQAVAPQIPDIFESPVEYLMINGYHIYIFDYDIVVDLI